MSQSMVDLAVDRVEEDMDERHIRTHHKVMRRNIERGNELSENDMPEAIQALKFSSIFKFCSDDHLRMVAKSMKRIEFKEGEVLMTQGDPQERVYLISSGTVARLRYVNDQLHQVETVGSDSRRGMFGALHVLKAEPTYATAVTETDGVAYTLESSKFNELLERNPILAKEVIYSLSKEVYRMSRLRTPLLEQDPHPASILPTSLGACIESYYRSGLNAWLNAVLTNKAPAAYFPNFHIQIPTRIIYINGFKQIRSFLSENIRPSDYKHSDWIRLGLAMIPGIMMTPISSILEACNADHMNPEPLHKRWTRGLLPRGVREIVFGLGINQLSDACEERASVIENNFLRACAGSLMAGVTAGYLSHVPHSIGTLKMLKPDLSYSRIMRNLIEENLSRTPDFWGPTSRRIGAALLTLFLPKGCIIRTTQICGSFIIINGTINIFSNYKTRGVVQE